MTVSGTWCFKHGAGEEWSAGWWQRQNGRWCNSNGGWHPYDPTDVVLCTDQDADSEARVRAWMEEHFLEPGSKSGWVAPDGRFFRVNYTKHDDFCDLWYGKSSGEIERTHVRLSYTEEFIGGPLMMTTARRLTKAQENTILDLGCDPNDVTMF